MMHRLFLHYEKKLVSMMHRLFLHYDRKIGIHDENFIHIFNGNEFTC